MLPHRRTAAGQRRERERDADLEYLNSNKKRKPPLYFFKTKTSAPPPLSMISCFGSENQPNKWGVFLFRVVQQVDIAGTFPNGDGSGGGVSCARALFSPSFVQPHAIRSYGHDKLSFAMPSLSSVRLSRACPSLISF